jgi:hypothetical protein
MLSKVVRLVLIIWLAISYIEARPLKDFIPFLRKSVEPIIPPTYTVVTGKVVGIMLTAELDKKFQLQTTEEILAFLIENSDVLIQASGMNAQTVKNVLIQNFHYSRRNATREMSRFQKPILKYNTQSYTKRWIDEWMVVIEDEDNFDALFDEMDSRLRILDED